MTAGIGDKFRKTFNSGNPTVTEVTNPRSAAGGTLNTDNLTGWPTDTAVDFMTYQKDASDEPIDGTQIDWKAIKSSNNLTTMTRVAGASDTGNSVGDVVEAGPTATWANDLVEGILVEHKQDGTHGAVTATSLTTSAAVLTTPKVLTSINDTNGNELFKVTATASAVNEPTVANAATGNAPTLTATGGDTNINFGLYGKGTGVTKTSNRIQLDTTNSTPSGVFAQTGWGFITVVGSVSSLSESITLPTAFTNLYSVVVQCIGAKAGSDPSGITDLTSDFADVFAASALPTTSGFKVYLRTRGATNFSANERWGYSWIAYGS